MRFALTCLLTLAVAIPAIAAEPNQSTDEKSIESTVLSLYNVISGPAGTRDWDKFNALFAPDARLVAYREAKPVIMTTADYITRAGANFAKNGFYEHPVDTKIDRFKDIAHVSSRYESRHAPEDAKPFATGVNHLELMRQGDKWLIFSIVWQQD